MTQGPAFADLISNSLEVHDETVSSDTDRHDSSGNARKGQRQANRLAQHHKCQVRNPARDDQGRNGSETKHSVVDEEVEHDQNEA